MSKITNLNDDEIIINNKEKKDNVVVFILAYIRSAVFY